MDDVEDPSAIRILRGAATPSNKFAEWFPLRGSGRQASFYDPKTQQFTLIDTCYSTHHLQFDNDANETLYFNELTGPMVGWIDTKVYDETKDEQKAVGWCGQVLDTNGDGKITKPCNQVAGGRGADSAVAASDAPEAAGPDVDLRGPIRSEARYAGRLQPVRVIPSPVDTAVWGVSERYPGYLVRMERGNNRAVQLQEPGLQGARSRASIRAASTSTATASSGRRSPPAATWRASTFASAGT